MSLTKQFQTDKQAEVDGIEVTFTPNDDGTLPTFVISRSSRGNPRYLRALERLTKPHRRSIEMKTLSKEQSEKVFRDVFIEGSLLGWKNVPKSDVTGDENDTGYADFNKENAEALFVRLPDLYDDLQSRSGEASNFRTAQLEEEAGN